MKILLFALSFFVMESTVPVSEYVGTWKYSIDTPDGSISGAMTLKYEDGEYSGTISAYGEEYEMLDVVVEGNQLNFKTLAAGYSSVIKGSFSGDKYTAIISVEGMQIPMTAVRE